ncbi:SUF system NifU family Fe-S cluster assembly protein [SAR202 cluster bacterium AD-802-K11_MRT_200m]|nr:SUF system NifU family Fe-S cluster assembly protein [SAR202 cluster bacterium AD-802-K11_MRT_200m]
MFDAQDLYQEIVMDHNRRPRNFGSIADSTSTSEGFNPLCGDQVTVFLKVSDEIVEDVSFEGVGCAISKSSASMMTEGVKGKSVEEALIVFQAFRRMLTTTSDQVEDSEILGDLEILKGVSQYPTRIKCATLSWHTLQAALQGSGSDVSTE